MDETTKMAKTSQRDNFFCLLPKRYCFDIIERNVEIKIEAPQRSLDKFEQEKPTEGKSINESVMEYWFRSQ